MSIVKKVAYLKGLAKGSNINESSKEGELLLEILNVLDEMAESIGDIEETCCEFDNLISIIDDDLQELEDDFYAIDEDDDYDFEDEELLDCDNLYEVTCPSCSDVVYLDEGTLLEGDMECPNCGEALEFDLDCEQDDCEYCNQDE